MSNRFAFIVLTSNGGIDLPSETIEDVLRKKLHGFVPPEWKLEHLRVIEDNAPATPPELIQQRDPPAKLTLRSR